MSEDNKKVQTSGVLGATEEKKSAGDGGDATGPTASSAPANIKPTTPNKNMPDKFKDLIEKIETMSVLDLHELVKALEEKFGVSAAAVAPASGGAGAPGAAAPDEQSTFTAVLTSAGEQKIAVMKIVKEVLSLGLKDAKDLVDAAPSTLKEGLKKEEAAELKKKIEEVGGKVELK